MDTAEAQAERFLQARGFSDVTYEPDGNVPPDFLCDGKIAVEVRRLNQQEQLPDGNHRGLEETEIPLLFKFRRLLSGFGPPTGNHSWFVSYRFGRPLPRWKKIEPLIRGTLEGFKNSPVHARSTIAVSREIEIEIFRASKVYDNQFFVLGGYSDDDSGGWVLAEIEKSLNVCIPEKSQKISKYRQKYPEWWLLLVDHIGYALDDFERDLLRDQVQIESDWDKIFLVDPIDGARGFEI